MKKLVTLLFLFVGLIGSAQVCPTPTTTGAFVTLDATYQLATTTAVVLMLVCVFITTHPNLLPPHNLECFMTRIPFQEFQTLRH